MSDFASTGNFRDVMALARRTVLALERIARVLEHREYGMTAEDLADAKLRMIAEEQRQRAEDAGATQDDAFPSLEVGEVYNKYLRGTRPKGGK